MGSIRTSARAPPQGGGVDQWEMLGSRLKRAGGLRLSNWIKTLQFEQEKGGGLVFMVVFRANCSTMSSRKGDTVRTV